MLIINLLQMQAYPYLSRFTERNTTVVNTITAGIWDCVLKNGRI